MAEPRRTGAGFQAAVGAVGAVMRNASMRRVLAAYAGFSLAEWATWIAVLVYAFGRGGAVETGIVALVQLAPSAFVAPIAAVAGDRVRRDRALLVAYLVQAAAIGVAAGALATEATSLAVYAAAAVVTTTITLTRPIQGAILPSLARTPAELTAANVAAATIETTAILVGPMLVGVGLVVIGPAAVFAICALISLAGALLVAGIRPVEAHQEPGAPSRSMAAVVGEALAGFTMLAREERPRIVVLLLGCAAVLWGVLDVFIVVLALDTLLLGEAGVGYMNAAVGAGGVIGAVVTVSLIGRPRLALPLGAGILLWAAPLALVGFLPGALVALLLLGVAGLGRVLMDVSGRTLLQRVAPDLMLARVFGILEGITMGSLAAGSILAPVLVQLIGVERGLILGGAALLLVTAIGWRSLARADASGVLHLRELELLRRIAIFAPLEAPAIERLAARLVPASAGAGSILIRQGEPGDRFYILVAGSVHVRVDGEVVRHQQAGEWFGEIALLRNVPRTATVEAVTPVELLTLDRGSFLEAVTGQLASHAAAASVVRERLGETDGPAAIAVQPSSAASEPLAGAASAGPASAESEIRR